MSHTNHRRSKHQQALLRLVLSTPSDALLTLNPYLTQLPKPKDFQRTPK